MSTREKILVGLMIVAVCLGTLTLISGQQKQDVSPAGPDQANTLTKMLTNLATQFGNDTQLEDDRYILATARSPWQDRLFLQGDLLAETTEASAMTDVRPANLSLVYSGYIETPQRRVAIINGIEYIEGELLDQTQLKIRHIDAKRVVLGATADKVFSVPLVDDWESATP